LAAISTQKSGLLWMALGTKEVVVILAAASYVKESVNSTEKGQQASSPGEATNTSTSPRNNCVFNLSHLTGRRLCRSEDSHHRQHFWDFWGKNSGWTWQRGHRRIPQGPTSAIFPECFTVTGWVFVLAFPE
jgi:hypothetical protein